MTREWVADMGAFRARRVNSIIPHAIASIEEKQNEQRGLERIRSLFKDAREEEAWSETPRSLECLYQRVANFEDWLQGQIGDSSRQLRNRHLLERNLLELPSEEARVAIGEDPGLRVFRSWDTSDDRVFLLARYDVGCAFCGKVFELNDSGNPISDDDHRNPRKALGVLEGVLLSAPSWRNCSIEEPWIPITCPHCGWSAPLDNRAMAVMAAYDTSHLCVIPDPHCNYMGSLGDSWKLDVFMANYNIDFNWSKSRTTMDETDVTYTGLPENVRVRLEEYPIVPMAKEVFRTNNLAMPISLMKERPTLNDLVASTRTL